MSSSSAKRSKRTRRHRSVVIALVVAVIAIAGIAVMARHRVEPSGVNPTSDNAREADQYFIIGLRAYRQHDWQRAIHNFEAALSFDDQHLDAQEHLELARSEERNEQTFERAQRAFDDGHMEEAVALATTIPTSSVYSEQAQELRRQASAASGD